MGGTLFWLLLWLVVVTVFALSNLTTETIRFWQWPVYTGPLGMIVVGAGVLGALLTYVGSLQHHVRQARQIRTLQGTVHEHEARQTPPVLGGGPAGAPMRSEPTEETRRFP
jgi:uncharacterized integral membrane protein